MLDRTPKGINRLDNPNTVEYQLFPERYFTGCDVKIYFGDIFISEISGLQFELMEKVKPIYGYASRTWDAVSRGNRMVKGYFKIPFKEAGYLDTVLGHIGQLGDKAQPAIAYKMGNQQVPDWVADAKTTIEELLTSTYSKNDIQGQTSNGLDRASQEFKNAMGVESRFANTEKEIWGRNFSNDKDHKYQTYFYTDKSQVDGTNWQKILKKTGFDVHISYGPIDEVIKQDGYAKDKYSFNNTIKAIRSLQLMSVGQTISPTGDAVEEVYTFIAKDLD